jgi:ligand-binding sensor domain-containing protein/signal transduction histidine kinase
MNIFRTFRHALFSKSLMVLMFAGFNTVTAQNSEYAYNHLSLEDGLSQSTVFCIMQNSKGFMWFGTRTGGLNKFDGYTFTHYKSDPENPYSISGNEILAIFEDSKGVLWVGTRAAGLNRFDYNSERFYRYAYDSEDINSIANDTVNAFLEDTIGRLLIATNSGLCSYNNKDNNFIRIPLSDKYSAPIVKSLIKADGDSIWIGTKEGVFLFDLFKNKILKHYAHDANNPKSISSSNVTKVFYDSRHRLWVGTRNNGLNLLISQKTDEFRKFRYSENNEFSLLNDFVRTINEDVKGNIWIGTSRGLEQLIPEEQEKQNPTFVHHVYDKNNVKSISQNSIYSFYIDRTENFWVGTWSGGVNYVDNNRVFFERYEEQYFNIKSFNNNRVSSFVEGKNGFWIGSESGGLNFFNRKENSFIHFKHDENNSNSLTTNNVKALYIDEAGILWIATSQGLNLFDIENNKFSHLLPKHIVYSIIEGLPGNIWIGTSKGLYKYRKSDNSFKHYHSDQTNPNSLSYDVINVIYKDKNNGIWIGTAKGLNYYNSKTDSFKRYRSLNNGKNKLSNEHITAICEDNNGILWIGTLNGLNKIDASNNSFVFYNEKDGLPDNVIHGILTDDHGNLWISTNRGISKINTSLLQNKNVSGIRNYNIDDGIQSNEFITNSSYKSSRGELFFGGINGFNIFHPDSIKDNPHIPNIVITDFKLFNKSVPIGIDDSPLKAHISQTETITLNHKQSVITFGFAALNYTSTKKNQYAYILEGFEKEWNYIGNKHEATYTNLPAGRYVFRVKGSNNDGIWNEKGTSLKIIVLNPWWKTWWFIVLVTLFCLFTIIALYLRRVKVLIKRSDILEQKINERTRELVAVYEELKVSHEEILHQKNKLENQKAKIEKAYGNIRTLAKIGAQITMSLNVENIVETAYNSLRSISKVQLFSIGLLDVANNRLVFKGVKESGQTLPPFSYDLDDQNRMSVWCFNNQKPALIKDFSKEYIKYVPELVNPAEGSMPNSLIYLPLNIMDKKIGVISIQAKKKDAYTDYHLNILKNIGIYAAIALDNAEAYVRIEKQAEELKIQKESLEETNATKDKFYSILAHDLKNPFGTMLGFLELLKLNFKSYNEEKKLWSIDIAYNSAKLILNLINNLLEWSRTQQGTMPFKPEKILLSAFVASELELFDNMLTEKNIDLRLFFEEKDLRIVADKNMLSTILRNFVSNAIKFTNHGGKIAINVRVTENSTLFEIIDSGIGIPENEIDKLFRLDLDFKREGTNKEKGTGMGLVLCNEFIQKHNGKVWVESAEGKGTTFFFTIPESV